VKVAEPNTVQMVWMPGHWGTEGNESADQSARMGLNIYLYDLSWHAASQ
jgi:ribonuclease HI